MNPDVPDDHPRAESLRVRHKISEAMAQGVVVEAGLIAHGRGEAFDYLLGERTREPAKDAMRAAVAALLTAKRPVISVNGNAAALVPEGLVELSRVTGAPLEVNLFYARPGRLEAIEAKLKAAGATRVLGVDPRHRATIKELSSNRRFVDARGIKVADVVLVPLEDGDRTEALVGEGKRVITIDLNPLSRTALKAHVTIVDNITRAIPYMVELARKWSSRDPEQLRAVLNEYDNADALTRVVHEIVDYLENRARNI
ncbi:MAG: 4-phosphopantoate--beta-alanine ligase [Promethearchaeota archaeon]